MKKRNAIARWKGTLKEGSGILQLESGAFEGPYSFATRFGDTAGNGLERFREKGSAYAAVADRIAARAGASQEGAMDAVELARIVVQDILAEKPPARIRVGRHSRMLPFLALLPIRWRERMFRRKFGLDQRR